MTQKIRTPHKNHQISRCTDYLSDQNLNIQLPQTHPLKSERCSDLEIRTNNWLIPKNRIKCDITFFPFSCLFGTGAPVDPNSFQNSWNGRQIQKLHVDQECLAFHVSHFIFLARPYNNHSLQ